MSDKTRIIITEIAIVEPDLTAAEVHEKLIARLREAGQPEVALSTTQKALTDIRPRVKTVAGTSSLYRNALDQPWSLASKLDVQIPPDVLALLANMQTANRELGIPFSVRDAQWFYKLTGYRIPDLTVAMRWAEEFALREQACAILGEPCDVSDIEAGLAKYLAARRASIC